MAQSRRTFLKRTAALSSLPILACVERSGLLSEARAEDNMPIAEDNPQAIALRYKHNAAEVDNSKSPKRAETQFCSNCQLLVERGMKVSGQAGEWGKCPIFQTGLVSANGWCSSWVPRANG